MTRHLPIILTAALVSWTDSPAPLYPDTPAEAPQYAA